MVVDLRRAHLVPVMRVVSDFVHQGQARDVVSVMVDGACTMRDGQVLTLEEDGLLSQAQELAERAWAGQFRDRPEVTPPTGFSHKGLPRGGGAAGPLQTLPRPPPGGPGWMATEPHTLGGAGGR